MSANPFNKQKFQVKSIKTWIVVLSAAVLLSIFLYAMLSVDFDKDKGDTTPTTPKIPPMPESMKTNPADELKSRAALNTPPIPPEPAQEPGKSPELAAGFPYEKERQEAIKESFVAPISSLSGSPAGRASTKRKNGPSTAALDEYAGFEDELASHRRDGEKQLASAQDYIKNSMAMAAQMAPGMGRSATNGNVEFLKTEPDEKTTNPYGLQSPVSKFALLQGSFIPAVMETAIISDLPGQVSARVRENIYDTATGQYLLIPQGSRLVGLYNSDLKYGQERVLVAWTRLIMPKGKNIVLANFQGADLAGGAGLSGDVDHHYFRIFGAAIFSSILNVGANAATGSLETPWIDSTIMQQMGSEAGQGINQAGQAIVSKNLNIQPTIHIQEGQRFTVKVGKDIVLERYRGG